MLLAIAPLSLSLDFFRVPQDKESEKTMKSTSNEEVGFVRGFIRTLLACTSRVPCF
jgi:hypothetical protein